MAFWWPPVYAMARKRTKRSKRSKRSPDEAERNPGFSAADMPLP